MSILKISAIAESTWNVKAIGLRTPSQEVSIEDLKKPWIKEIILDMFETLYSTPSGVGLAAPQVGIQLRIIVIDIKRDAKKPMVLINPSYEAITSNMIDSNESCLSVPGLSGTVKRFEKIKVRYLSESGVYVEKEATGFEGVVFQHEIDHLDGILYIDRIKEKNQIKEEKGHANRLANRAVEKFMGDEKNVKR